MLSVRRSEDRGHFNHGWLETYHSFSFAGYQNTNYMGFSSLQVINEDIVQHGEGFGVHPHSNMEIICYIISGGLMHKDSMNNESKISRGDVQLISAGTGITHSEYNQSVVESAHFLQIWIRPREKNITPSYQKTFFSEDEKVNKLKLVVSQDGSDGSLKICQDARIYAAIFDAGKTIELPLSPGRHTWVHLISGDLEVSGETLKSGDGIAIVGEPSALINAFRKSEFLLFDLP